MDELVIALAQCNPTIGDLERNAAMARRARADAGRKKADIVVMPELCLVGCPPEALVRNEALLGELTRSSAAWLRKPRTAARR